MADPIDWNDLEHVLLIAGWLKMADENPPDKRNWHVLVGKLRRAAEDSRQAGDSDQTRLNLLQDTAVAVLDFFNQEVALADPQVRSSLMPLLNAIADVNQGRPADLFNPPRPPKRPPLSVAQANTAGAAARALSELMSCGVSPSIASERVSRAAKTGLCSGFGKITGKRIQGWRERIHEGEGSISIVAIKRYHAPLPPHVGDTANERADFILGALRYGKTFR